MDGGIGPLGLVDRKIGYQDFKKKKERETNTENFDLDTKIFVVCMSIVKKIINVNFFKVNINKDNFGNTKKIGEGVSDLILGVTC